jgi:hypothetical protein
VGNVAFERCRLLWPIDKARDTVIDRDAAIRGLPTKPGAGPARLAEPHIIRIDDTGKTCGQPYLMMPIIRAHRRASCPAHPRAARISEVCALQEFCKTPAGPYLRERPGRYHRTTVKAPPPAQVPPATKGARK